VHLNAKTFIVSVMLLVLTMCRASARPINEGRNGGGGWCLVRETSSWQLVNHKFHCDIGLLIQWQWHWLHTLTAVPRSIDSAVYMEQYKKDGYRQQNVRQRQKLISIRGLSRSLR